MMNLKLAIEVLQNRVWMMEEQAKDLITKTGAGAEAVDNLQRAEKLQEDAAQLRAATQILQRDQEKGEEENYHKGTKDTKKEGE